MLFFTLIDQGLRGIYAFFTLNRSGAKRDLCFLSLLIDQGLNGIYASQYLGLSHTGE